MVWVDARVRIRSAYYAGGDMKMEGKGSGLCRGSRSNGRSAVFNLEIVRLRELQPLWRHWILWELPPKTLRKVLGSKHLATHDK